jgi:hypothetical protein
MDTWVFNIPLMSLYILPRKYFQFLGVLSITSQCDQIIVIQIVQKTYKETNKS